jgi:hypothetical protein
MYAIRNPGWLALSTNNKESVKYWHLFCGYFTAVQAQTAGRHHSAWTLEAEVRPLDGDRYRSEVKLDLRYGGSMWSGLLDGVLHHAADEATERLQAYLSATR